MKMLRLVLWTTGLVLTLLSGGCAAPMDASKSLSRSVIRSGGIVDADQVRVAEYLNYYEQRFPEPITTTLGLDLRLGNGSAPAAGGDAWLQIGVQAKSARPEEIAPLTLALVIDCSGSMADAGKMDWVKRSLHVFLNSLAANDQVTLIGYSDDAWRIESMRTVGDGAWIAAAIDRLEPTASTNLYSGLMLGLREVDRRYDPARNNRVILLTDGIANVGVTDPQAIAADARVYNDRGIYLATIGLGHDVNDALLSELAIQGKGPYHFIDSAQEMDKVFRKDALGLMAKVAANVSVSIRPAPGVQIMDVTGFEGTLPSGPVQVSLRDLAPADNQVLLVRLRLAPDAPGQMPLVAVELSYDNLNASRREVLASDTQIFRAHVSAYDPLLDAEVLRNVTIQRSAEGLKEISRLADEQRYVDAWRLAHDLEEALRRVAELTGDEQMVNDAEMMVRYQHTLAQWMPEEPRSDRERSQPTRFYRGGAATPPVIEIK